MSVKESILDLFFPPKCAFCGQLMPRAGDGICPKCRASLPFRPEGEVLTHKDGFPCAVTLYYDEQVVTGVHAMKFEGKSGRAAVFARIMAQTAAEQFSGAFDAVTFVPVSPLRNFRRGYDQAQLIAEAMGRIWGVKAEKTLVKIRNNPPQSSVKTAADRARNVKNVYRPRKSAAIRGRRFLLVDDVYTTGSTMTACARTLMEAGAASVVCAALAGGHRR